MTLSWSSRQMRREMPEQKQIRRGWMQKVEEEESEREEEEEEENRQREGQIVSKFCSCQMENNRELGLRETTIFTFPLKSVQTSHQYHISTSTGLANSYRNVRVCGKRACLKPLERPFGECTRRCNLSAYQDSNASFLSKV